MSGSKKSHAIEIFPFLAVLVCTMGSLIFLLLLTSRQVRERAMAYSAYIQAQRKLASAETPPPPKEEPKAEPEEEPPKPVIVIPPLPKREKKSVKIPDQSYMLALANRERELSELKSKWQTKATQLAKERERRRSQLMERKTLIESSVEQTNAMKSEVEALEVQLGQLAGESATSSLKAEDRAELLTIERQIAEAKKRIRNAQAAEELGNNEKFQVVPFDPQSGTTRRPILIECTEAGIRFIPEDITVTAADLDGFIPRVNPLAIGTAALINYWSAWNSRQKNPKAQPEPYVLLLVRPNGVVAYYVAMRMLEHIRTAHGYELIDEATVLQLPELDMGAQAACQTAINRLLAERESVYRTAVGNGASGSVFGGGLRRHGNGGRAGSGSASSSEGGGNSDGGQPGGNVFTMTDVTGNDQPVGGRSWERPENFEGRQRRRSGGAGTGGDVGGGGSATGVTSVFDRSTGEDGIDADSDTDASTGDRTASRKGAANRSHLRTGASMTGKGTNRTGDTDSTVTTTQNGQSGSASATDESQETNRGNSGGSQPGGGGGNGGGGSATGPQGRWQSNPPKSNGGGSYGPAGGYSESEPGMPIGQRPGKKRGSAKQGANSATDGQPGEPGDETADMSGPNDGSGSRSGSPSDRSRLSDSASSQPRYANGSRSGRSGGKPKSTDKDAKELEPEMLAGRRWGFAEPGASIGFEREVKVDVSADMVVIADKYDIPVGRGETKQETFEIFVSSLDKCSHEWGRPPQGFFWTPRIKFVVKPDADAQYEQINAMMTRAGLATSHEFFEKSNTIKYGRDPRFTKSPAPKAASTVNSGGAR